ncbi:hypothetical protein [Burkholderia sp. AU6039]|uniref:hypothetical protein n=1 Tax=Burkholderia sp. AU6039 TaxID=2015344 RepID=UPI00117C23A3|nr:hypothetical protein [Burkholderia sp. AU6039]
MIDRLRLQAVDFLTSGFHAPPVYPADLVAPFVGTRAFRPIDHLSGGVPFERDVLGLRRSPNLLSPILPRSGTFSQKNICRAIVCARPRGVQFIHHMPISGGRA